MRIIYRKEIPGKAPRTTVYGGWLAFLVGLLVMVGLVALAILLLPFFLALFLGILALIFFAMVAGWISLAMRIGFRDMWDLTRLMFSIMFSRQSWGQRQERIMKEWEDRVKGKHGQWQK